MNKSRQRVVEFYAHVEGRPQRPSAWDIASKVFHWALIGMLGIVFIVISPIALIMAPATLVAWGIGRLAADMFMRHR